MAMYELEQLKDLLNTIDKTGISCFEIRDEKGQRLMIKKETGAPATVIREVQPAQNAAAQASGQLDAPKAETQKDDGMQAITAPMVGVFYAAPSPDAAPYVSVGSAVKKGDVICIIEAMKLMNEITATQDGTIKEICVQNGDIVEFGQPLFKIL